MRFPQILSQTTHEGAKQPTMNWKKVILAELYYISLIIEITNRKLYWCRYCFLPLAPPSHLKMILLYCNPKPFDGHSLILLISTIFRLKSFNY